MSAVFQPVISEPPSGCRPIAVSIERSLGTPQRALCRRPLGAPFAAAAAAATELSAALASSCCCAAAAASATCCNICADGPIIDTGTGRPGATRDNCCRAEFPNPTPNPNPSGDVGPDRGPGEFRSAPGFCFFHFVRLFWNQIFTC